ncbi:Type IV secretion system protein VirB6 [Paraburkholderia ultramafica]|uniref:Type IV secretion system protein VirB6 n=1 Tax=Paraburkholderia ultramafica TaxID=1544867 RepID=A0A6S7D0E7_9BURK|nr:type IV secretion system protein [Paraburkholderia ultramafica]CAB3802653.1 Type IV secretion system protein VirB6 [Paraburkholderia ultramafica]
MDFHLFTDLFRHIDAATATFATDVSGRVITAAMPVISAGLTLSFIFYGFLVARGAVDHSLKDFMWKCLKISLIVSVASAGGIYQSQIAGAIQTAPDEFATALLPASAPSAQGTQAATMIDQAASEGFSKAGDAFEKAGIFSKEGLSYTAFGVLCLLSTALFTAIGGAFILLAKIMLALLAALGPLFIFALIFKATTGFFERWAGHVLGFSMLIVFVSAVFGLMIQLFTTYMEQASFDNGLNFAGTIGGCVVLAVAFLFIIIKLPEYASAMMGGIAAGLWYEARIAAGIGRQTSGAGQVAVGSAAKAGAAGAGAGRAAGGAVRKAAGRFKGSRSG